MQSNLTRTPAVIFTRFRMALVDGDLLDRLNVNDLFQEMRGVSQRIVEKFIVNV